MCCIHKLRSRTNQQLHVVKLNLKLWDTHKQLSICSVLVIDTLLFSEQQLYMYHWQALSKWSVH